MILQEKDGHLVCTLASADDPGPYDAELLVCKSPTCQCHAIEIQLTSAGTKHRGRFDLAQKALADKEDADAVMQSLAAALTDDDWKSLDDHYHGSKADLSEDVDDGFVDAVFPIEQIEYDGKLVHYADIFPYAESLDIEVGTSRYWLQDMYCLSSGHPCEEITYLFIPAEIDSKDYRRHHGTAVCVTTDGGFVDELQISTIPTVHPPAKLAAELKKRDDILRRCRKRRATLLRLYARVAADLRQAPAALGPKAGRNDPCPCGSGKKFKKCCLRADATPIEESVERLLKRQPTPAPIPQQAQTLRSDNSMGLLGRPWSNPVKTRT